MWEGYWKWTHESQIFCSPRLQPSVNWVSLGPTQKVLKSGHKKGDSIPQIVKDNEHHQSMISMSQSLQENHRTSTLCCICPVGFHVQSASMEDLKVKDQGIQESDQMSHPTRKCHLKKADQFGFSKWLRSIENLGQSIEKVSCQGGSFWNDKEIWE